MENSKHIAEEERGACATSASTPMSPCCDELGRRWLEYRAAHEGSPDVDAVDKDAATYIAEHEPG